MSSSDLELFVFHRQLDLDRAGVAAGAAGVVVDLETRDKPSRQKGFDTQINDHTVDDVARLKEQTDAQVICRINGVGGDSDDEVRGVVDAGADEVLIPMVTTNKQVDQVFDLVGGDCRVGIMIETSEAVEIAGELDDYPLSRIYVGLNDLRISRGTASIFSAIADGMLTEIRDKVQRTPFGFGGLTIPGCGDPLAVEHLVNEVSRLDCQFTFLRRSFFRDTQGQDLQVEIPRIVNAVREADVRPDAAVDSDRLRMLRDLDSLLA
jgi:hypothetical protein